MIIGICGSAYAGKTTVADIIRDASTNPYTIIPFAKALKDMAKSFGWDGKKDEKGRRFLQLLGTDVGRCYIPTFWVDRWEDAVMNSFDSFSDAFVIADDVRFPNEVESVKGAGGIVLKILADEEMRQQRAHDKGEKLPPAHASEVGIPDEDIDHVIVNNYGSTSLLRTAVVEWFTRVLIKT